MYGDGHKELAKPVDLCEKTPYERQRIKDAWLSIPKTTPVDPCYDSYTLVRRTPFGLSVPALKAKCSPHTAHLAIAKFPLPQMHFVTRAEREMQKELEEEMTKAELKWLKRKFYPPPYSGVRKSALYGKTTPRIDTMALAKLSILNETKRQYFMKLPQQQRKSLIKSIKEHYQIFAMNYPPEAQKIYVLAGGTLVHTSCTGRQEEKKKKIRYLCEMNRNQRRIFRRRMKQMGLPKKAVQPSKGPDRGPKKKLKDFEPWLTTMCQPKYHISMEKPFNPFKVKSSAKFYVPTERILIISKPKEIPPPPPLVDYEGNELPPRREWSYTSRKRIVASQRTIELAVPKFVKKKAADDVKEDPYAVPRRALTAYCSPRTRELAEPKQR